MVKLIQLVKNEQVTDIQKIFTVAHLRKQQQLNTSLPYVSTYKILPQGNGVFKMYKDKPQMDDN